MLFNTFNMFYKTIGIIRMRIFKSNLQQATNRPIGQGMVAHFTCSIDSSYTKVFKCHECNLAPKHPEVQNSFPSLFPLNLHIGSGVKEGSQKELECQYQTKHERIKLFMSGPARPLKPLWSTALKKTPRQNRLLLCDTEKTLMECNFIQEIKEEHKGKIGV